MIEDFFSFVIFSSILLGASASMAIPWVYWLAVSEHQ